jgi:hypothetical protein
MIDDWRLLSIEDWRLTDRLKIGRRMIALD